jgi:hypothetical protein
MPTINQLQGIQYLRPQCLPIRENVERATESCPLRGIYQSHLCQNADANCSGNRKGN